MSINKAVLIRLSGMTLAIAGLWLVWSQAQQARPPLTIEKVTEGLYVIVGNGGNVAAMPTSEGVLLVDDKFAQDAPEILAKVKTISDKPIRYVLNTHQHGDHTGGNAPLLAASAEIIIQKNARANMAAGKMPGIPRITFSDETQVFLGGKEVRARYLGRGHTNGDAVIFFPSERVLHTGDLCMIGMGPPFIDYSAGGSLVEWDKTLEQALQYDFDIVIPGHGPVSKKADLVKWRESIVNLRTKSKAACAAGGVEALKKMNLAEVGLTSSAMFDRSMPGVCQELK